jgi:hypothetical protein
MFDPSFIYDELPTKYDLYYFKWFFYSVSCKDISETILHDINNKNINMNNVEKYMTYLLIRYHEMIEWIPSTNYIIITDDYTLNESRSPIDSKLSYILDFRGKEFKLNMKFTYNHIKFELADNPINRESFLCNYPINTESHSDSLNIQAPRGYFNINEGSWYMEDLIGRVYWCSLNKN